MTPKESFKSLEEKDIVFNVYSLEHHGVQPNTVMGNAREIAFAKMYHMTNIQRKTMFWYVMSTEELQKMNSFL